MAHSHHSVGVAFGKFKKAVGSRMSTINTQQATPHNDDMAAIAGRTFYLLQDGTSYRTVVARVMRNAHTKRNELWLTSRYYSSSTERHKGYFRTGFNMANSQGFSNDDIYHTPCIEDSRHRNDPSYVLGAIHSINATLPDVDRPRLREATRRGTLTSCLHKANVVLRNFTHAIPLDKIDADAYYDLQYTIDFLTTTLAIADIDEVRAAVKGYLALNDITKG